MSYDRHEPEFVEHPGYGIYPCPNPWHTTKSQDQVTGECPDCPNPWWAVDDSECPEEYALIAEIDVLRKQSEEYKHELDIISEWLKK